MSVSRELYEFLIDAELGHYHSALKNELKIASVQQLKYVREEDLLDIGMSRPEMRRLKKYYRREHPQGIERIYRAIKKTPSDVGHRLSRPLSPGGMQDPRSSRAHYIRPPGKQIIPAHCLVINKTLGEGEFGVVQQGIWTTEEGEKVQVAIKCLSKDRMQSATADFLKEAGIMQSTDHEHLVRMFGVVLDKENALMLVTELAPMRSLLECLKAPSLRLDFPIVRLCEFSQQICDGMSYLESKRLIHRDLAARNVLVFSKHQVKISDFGLSRALGVGKDYYQCKFTSTLKLPIAWCAPETINYLKFTSASDVWSFAVTLWELFTYGFQPWAGLTGQQILDTIDTPRCQHLDQPELCPQEYYQLMCKCWEYEPQDRPTFSQIFMKLPQIRPILVKAVRDAVDSGRNDFLIFKAYEVIVVIDKNPSDAPWPGLWKGALNNGRSGLFDPTNTVPFLEPKMSPIEHKANIVRRESSRKSSRKIRLDMIGKPMDDLRHTGHIGYDGAIFGDVSFIGDNVDKLPIKRSNPVLVIPRPSLAKLHPHHARVGIDRSLNSLTVNFQKTAGSMADVGGSSISLQRFSDSPDRDHPVRVSQSELSLLQQQPNTSNGIQNTWMSKESLNSRVDDGHDGRRTPPYQDIDDDDDTGGLLDDFDFKLPDLSSSLDFGPSLMDEVFKALSERQVSADSTPESDNLSNNHIKGDSPPLPAPRRDYSAEPPPVPTSVPRAELRREVNGGRPVDHKHQVKVKPMSTSDQKLMEEAIHYAHEFSRQNSQGYVTEPPVTPPIFTTGDDSGSGSESPRIIEKLKHPFRKTSSSSPKPERVRTFSEEIANKGDDELPAESQEAYNVLVAHRSFGIDSSVRDNEHPVISHPVIISSPRLSNGHALEIRTSVDRSTPKPTVPPRPLPRQYSSDMKKPVEPPPPRPRPEVQRVEPLVRRLSIEEKPLLKSDVSDSNENVDYKDNDGYIPDSDINVPPPKDERSILDDRLGSSAEAFNSNRSSSNTDSSESEASSKSRTEDQQVVELKSSLLFDEEDLEPSPREIMTRLARERRLKRSMDHQNHVEVSESAIPMPNRNIREPQGIPGMKPAPLATAENDVEVETNPLRMLRGGAIPIRGSRGGIQGRRAARR